MPAVNGHDAARVTQSPEKAAALGLVVNAALATVKLLTGILGHSFALVADAVESMHASLRELFDLAPWRRGSVSLN